ncbi:MAG: 23S rRNA (guanosine(2251)-2'-O)-methyltransferase RlmB [Bacilli bacterium]
MSIYMYGRIPVLTAINNKKTLKVFLLESEPCKDVLDSCKKNSIEPVLISNAELGKLSNGGIHQGVVALCKDYEYSSLEEVITESKKVSRPIILMLDGIEDPHNLGAIIRCADAFGVSGLIIKKRNQVLINATVIKVSTGASDFIKTALVTNLSSAIEVLKSNGFWIVSSDGKSDVSYSSLKYDMPIVLVIGSEGFGISKLVLDRSDFVVKIPMLGHVNSLNASVATGIILSYISSH